MIFLKSHEHIILIKTCFVLSKKYSFPVPPLKVNKNSPTIRTKKLARANTNAMAERKLRSEWWKKWKERDEWKQNKVNGIGWREIDAPPRLTTFSIKSQGCSQRDGDADDRIANPAINTSKRAGISPRGRYNLHPRPLIHSLEKAARVQCTVK